MSPSALISGWNTSVQSWLKERVYRRLPKATPRSARMLATFAVSAFWHGVHPGYYLMFAGLFVMVGVEQLVVVLVRQLEGAPALGRMPLRHEGLDLLAILPGQGEGWGRV